MSQFPTRHLIVGGENDPFLPCLIEAINHASKICFATAFVRLSGLRLLMPALEDALQRGNRLRIVTGDYLCLTDPKALRHLMYLVERGAEVKVFESQGCQSFHMKAYLFVRTMEGLPDEGCVFVGSSNISHSALGGGMEWNLRVDRAENPSRFNQIQEEFETVYGHPHCVQLSHPWIDAYARRVPPPAERPEVEPGAGEEEQKPEPNAIQQEALAALQASRERGYVRGLVVLATGLGKTWLAAFDSESVNASRVLFVAHREEILDQAEATFVRIRSDAKVGRYDGRQHDLAVDMLFASVQTLGKQKHLEKFASDHFDYIVVDEFHHAAARTYQRLLGHFSPRFLLGLTATPERTDQADILALCDDNEVYRKDLLDGVDSGLLCPFHYFGIADVVDYQEISWRSGKFDPEQLVNQLATQARAKHALRHWQQRRQARTLAFCVSQKHADFMANYFSRHGVLAVAVHSNSDVRRNQALEGLSGGRIEVVFSVDLFNEGVDLPAIDTVLMLRPTDSKIVFLQQLGRGMRNSPETEKTKLVVLDFIGNHISFFRKPEALFGVGVSQRERRDYIQNARDEKLALPSGCFVNYDLESIRFMQQLTDSRVDKQQDIYRALRETLGRRPSLAEFYRSGGAVTTVRQHYGSWFEWVQSEGDLNSGENTCLSSSGGFLKSLETTQLTKSFKLILIEALVELDGFQNPPSTETLAKRSFGVVQRRPALWRDLPNSYNPRDGLLSEQTEDWHKYWLSNPVNAWVGGNRSEHVAFFALEGARFVYKDDLEPALLDNFYLLVQELIDYRFLQYEARLASRESVEPINPVAALFEERQEIPYFSDLRIACGHFRTSTHESEKIEHKALPEEPYGKLDPARHFIARAKGDSMDGGRHPIRQGDYLLLELISSESAGSNDGKIIAIERQDSAGDDQYLLRRVKKEGDGSYQLIAQNPAYPMMIANEEMATFARFKAVVDPTDLYLHQSFMREDIPGLFDLDFNPGSWNAGHVRPAGCADQFLLVTINKQGKAQDHQYHDYFIDRERFHWQSQNSTAMKSSKGQALVNHQANGGRVHLFVRKNKLEMGKGAPFIYCGEVMYQKHEGERPMSVEWALASPLSEELFSRLT